MMSFSRVMGLLTNPALYPLVFDILPQLPIFKAFRLAERRPEYFRQKQAHYMLTQ
jgi:hypothetical protein